MVRQTTDTWRTWLKIATVLASQTVWLTCGRCANILVVPVDGSHWVNMKLLVRELHNRGHNITVMRSSSSWYITEDPTLYHSVTIQASGRQGFLEDHQRLSQFVLNSLEIFRGGYTLTAFFRNIKAMREMLHEMHCQQRELISLLFGDGELMGRLRSTQFQLVLTDPFFPIGIMLAHHLALPLVYNARWLGTGDGHHLIAPSPTSFVPVVGSRYTEKMSLLQRMANAFHYFATVTLAGAMIHPGYDELCRRYVGPGTSIDGLTQLADLWLMRVDFVFDFPRPTMPNVVYIGGFQCQPPAPVGAELEAFMQSSGEHGVVYMSLGTLVTSLPPELTVTIAEAFARLPQKVIWRHLGERPANLGNNTLLASWVPQNDILGHPKTRAFVSHGGTNGLYEAIYHGVPVLGLPLIFDQFDNLVRLEARGAAKVLDPMQLDSGQLLDALTEVLSQPSYRNSMARLSALHHDQPQLPMERAVFWIEFVLRHRGATHLRSASFGLPWYTYYNLDVLALVVLVWCALSALTLLALRRLCRALWRRKEKQP
ncbi:UDP-glucuronosyltransferase 2A1-like [Scyliorhinus canicula]|uniref:UDP-glucuronosyltransferase 2A1-like n=1 Tax=Scyliorhinus canicula TaxID=7830 RepID=UPI0018F6B7F3|nr:UDP-glucuronosyltransferase 2A1-like [Scyliorhinus canicula]